VRFEGTHDSTNADSMDTVPQLLPLLSTGFEPLQAHFAIANASVDRL